MRKLPFQTIFLTLLVSMSVSHCNKSEKTVTPEAAEKGLKDFAGDMQIGVRVDHSGLFGAEKGLYTGVFNREFNSGTVTCYPAWDAWTGPNQYDLKNTNDRINYLESKNKTQMMHLLVAPDQYFPDWFKETDYPNIFLENMMEDWIRAMITSNDNATKVEVWNVVNEALSWAPPYGYNGIEVKWHQLGWEEDQSGLTGSEKVLQEHPVYIRKAFEYSRKYTNAKLELRDSGGEFPSGPNSIKYKTFYQLTRHLLNSGVPIDAVGFQVHLDLDQEYNWDGFKANILRFRDLGLETYLTEIDIGDIEESWNENKAERQRIMYERITRIAVETGVEYMHFWGLRDGQDKGWRTEASPLIFDEAFQPKPAYAGVEAALKAQ